MNSVSMCQEQVKSDTLFSMAKTSVAPILLISELQITPTYQPDHAALRKIGVSLFHHAYNAGDFPEASSCF
ncbi:hypothetical protein DPMN_166935 [Dreissena polymorpha]|uniref:Uncharacterized protein n=1 Tax=Dreissena polymorpha TaxID=45954 RepID=A0A9D4EYX2_DREPO|nr:hypothetical protein DPMN_166935 [Dreissena polymorpha]